MGELSIRPVVFRRAVFSRAVSVRGGVLPFIQGNIDFPCPMDRITAAAVRLNPPKKGAESRKPKGRNLMLSGAGGSRPDGENWRENGKSNI